MYLQNSGLRKTRLGKCLKSPDSEDQLTGNVVNGSKHCFNLNERKFTIFIDQREGNWVGKNHSYWHGKSEGCLLTYWLPMTSILFLIETIQWTQFRCIHLKNKTVLSIILCSFQIYIKFWTISKKDHHHSICISETTDSERRG